MQWIWGTQGEKFLRISVKTRSWEKAEEYRRQLETPPVDAGNLVRQPYRSPEASAVAFRVERRKSRVTIEAAVEAYLRDARTRSLEVSTLSKLSTIFQKQFLSWTKSEGYKFLDEIDLDALMSFRDTWIDGPLAKRKKQERLIGFFGCASAVAI